MFGWAVPGWCLGRDMNQPLSVQPRSMAPVRLLAPVAGDGMEWMDGWMDDDEDEDEYGVIQDIAHCTDQRTEKQTVQRCNATLLTHRREKVRQRRRTGQGPGRSHLPAATLHATSVLRGLAIIGFGHDQHHTTTALLQQVASPILIWIVSGSVLSNTPRCPVLDRQNRPWPHAHKRFAHSRPRPIRLAGCRSSGRGNGRGESQDQREKNENMSRLASLVAVSTALSRVARWGAGLAYPSLVL